MFSWQMRYFLGVIFVSKKSKERTRNSNFLSFNEKKYSFQKTIKNEFNAHIPFSIIPLKSLFSSQLHRNEHVRKKERKERINNNKYESSPKTREYQKEIEKNKGKEERKERKKKRIKKYNKPNINNKFVVCAN